MKSFEKRLNISQKLLYTLVGQKTARRSFGSNVLSASSKHLAILVLGPSDAFSVFTPLSPDFFRGIEGKRDEQKECKKAL